MPTIEEIVDILTKGFSKVCETENQNIDVYNVTETFPGTYTYDASIYFTGDNAVSESTLLYDRLQTSTVQFNQDLVSEIEVIEPDLVSTISMSVDPSDLRFTRSVSKGRSRPRFDRLIPSIESFDVNLDISDFLEIKDISCIRSNNITTQITNVTTSFVVHTNVLSEKINWRIKLSSDPNLENTDGFDTWMRSVVASQAQSYFTNNTVETTISNKQISTPFSDLIYVYIMVYFDNSPTFSTLFLKTA